MSANNYLNVQAADLLLALCLRSSNKIYMKILANSISAIAFMLCCFSMVSCFNGDGRGTPVKVDTVIMPPEYKPDTVINEQSKQHERYDTPVHKQP